MQTQTQPHAAQWFYLALLSARAPVGTHPAHNTPLKESLGGVGGIVECLMVLSGMAVMNGYTGGAA